MLRRVLILICLSFIVSAAGMAQQGASEQSTQQGRTERDVFNANNRQSLKKLSKERELTAIKPRIDITNPPRKLEPPRRLEELLRERQYPKRADEPIKESVLPAPGVLSGRDPTKEHGVAEAHVNQKLSALGISAAKPLNSSILRPTTSAEDCDRSQIALGSSLSDNKANLASWERTLSMSSVITKSELDKLIKGGQNNLLKRLSDYNRDCLTDLAQLNPASALARNLSLVVGVLLENQTPGRPAGAWGVLCSATRIGTDLVLTAKHCFYRQNAGQIAIPANILRAVKAGSFKFSLPMVRQEMNVVSIECVADGAPEPDCVRYGPRGQGHAGFGSDFVLLRVSQPSNLNMPELIVNSTGVRPGSEVMLVGWNLFAAIEAVYRQQSGSDIGLIKVSLPLRLSRAGTCTIATLRNVCMVHTCQSSSGTSGASLIQAEPNGALRVVGLHVAPTDSSEAYMGRESCDLDPLRIENLYQGSSLRYAGNIGLQLAP